MSDIFFSVIVPAYNASAWILDLFRALESQTYKNYELVVVDDCSTDETVKIARQFNCRIIQMDRNRGPAFCRNEGARRAKGKILVFTDSDCEPAEDWLEKMALAYSEIRSAAIMGKVQIKPSTYMGNSISALGFPAGGSIGFEKIWKVNSDSSTDSLSSCNCALPVEIFWKIGGFDENFPFAGGEDSLFAYNLRKSGYQIKYVPEIKISHAARHSLRDFLRWHFKRGVSSYIFAQKIDKKRKFISLRFWSTRNILSNFYRDKKFPMILLLLLMSFSIQLYGYLYTKRTGGHESPHN